MEITDLTPAEIRVREAFPRGETLDFRTSVDVDEGQGQGQGQGRGQDDDPALGGSWGPERTVRAEVIRALLLDGARADGEIAALRLVGARVTGVLNLQYGTVDCAVSLWGCHFDSAPRLYGTQVRQLNLSKSVLPALDAGSIRVDGVLRITDCRIRGAVRLGGARISGAFFCDRAQLGDPTPPREDGEGPRDAVLHLNHSVIGDDVLGQHLTAHGEVRLDGASVEGMVTLDDAVLDNPGGNALEAQRLTVGSDLHAMRVRARGRINLRGARVPGQLNLAYARISHPGGMALRATSLVAGELWLREAAPVEGTVTLRRSQLDMLHIAPETWPDRIRLDGLTYTTLAPHEPAERRLAALERDTDGYVPHAYEQLTAAYRRIGDDAGARTVQLAKQRRHRTTLPWYARAWGHLQDLTVGYGFRPARAVGWLLSLLLIGTLAYELRNPRPLEDEVPEFNALFYTLDLLLPIVDFGQERAYTAHGPYQFLSYVLIVTGWVLATTIAAGITRTISRQ
ncbi:membrane-associated oxidoreductase [Streptomyces sp. E11-3]|uniref:membrane-associated oxidoreductase n=1 Tax=Streptomyces sp. E11-3 TaxID=3110112 RepID=UPI0039805A12